MSEAPASRPTLIIGERVTVTSGDGASRSGLLIEIGARYTVELESGTRLRALPAEVRRANAVSSPKSQTVTSSGARTSRPRRWWRAHPFRTAAAAVVVAFVVLGAIAGVLESGRTDASVAVPTLVGLRLDDAHNALKDRGLRNFDDHDAFGARKIVVDSNWTVVSQDPEPGRLVAADDTVAIDAGKTGEGNTAAALGLQVRSTPPTSAEPTTAAPTPPITGDTSASVRPSATPRPALETARACDLAPLDYLASVGFEVEPCDETDVRRSDSADAVTVLDRAGNNFILSCDAGPYDVTLSVTAWKIESAAVTDVDSAAATASDQPTGSISPMSPDLSTHGVFVDVPDNGAASAKWVVGAVQYDLLLQYYDLGWDHPTVLSTLTEGVARVNAATSRYT